MRAHLPALQVVLPLFGALLAALVRRPGPAWVVTLAVSWLLPVISGILLIQVVDSGAISYRIGGWDPSLGIEYRIDAVNAPILMLVSAMAAVIAPYARPSVLILTAIVVGVGTLALGLALVVRINEAYGTIEEEEIFARDEAE